MLVAVDGVELTYDEIGNVLTFGSRSFTWNSGRNLAQITDNGHIYSYKYDENGIRTSKTVNGVTTYYNTKDGVIISQSNGTDTMYFQHDTSGVPLGFIFNGTQYFYMTNQMGDVIAVTEQDGDIICEYGYDEWGKLIGITYVDEENAQQLAVANANPIRYRGYYYDAEIGYYYLQSRYYDPSICRFINADIPEIAQLSKEISTGTNLFAYCNNDPVNNVDYSGKSALSFSQRLLMSHINYKYNKKLAGAYFTGYIFGQGNNPVAKMRYGLWNIKNNGCEVVALYNALKYLGKFTYFVDLIRELELSDGLWRDGFFGTYPQAIATHIIAHGLKFKAFFTLKSLDKQIGYGKCFIFVYMHSGGIHTVMARGAALKKGLIVYNRYNNSINAEYISSFSQLIKKDGIKMIVGYMVF